MEEEAELKSLIVASTELLKVAFKKNKQFFWVVFTVLFSEILLFLTLLTISYDTLWTAAVFALLFFSIFATLTLRVSHIVAEQARLRLVKDDFLKQAYQYYNNKETTDLLSLLSQACQNWAISLQGKESKMLGTSLPNWSFLQIFAEDISTWYYANSFLKAKELLLKEAAQLLVQKVKLIPTQVEVHVHLAECYLMLAGLWITLPFPFHLWPKYKNQYESKFKAYAQAAAQELEIVTQLKPNDPWGFVQLAHCFHDLKQTAQEKQALEKAVCLDPYDHISLDALGRLYFSEGLNAKGFELYLKLSQIDSHKGEKLLQNYGII